MPDQVSGLLSPWLRRRRMQAALPHLRGDVLDYGCGAGELATACSPERYVGVDRDGDVLALARQRFPRYRFLSEPEEDATFDTVVALAVLEHAADAAELLCRFRRALRPRGRIVLTTPAPALEWTHALGVRLRLFSPEAAAEHQQLIGRTRMAALASQARLRIVLHQRFLLGANQLFVLTPATDGISDRAEDSA